MGCVQSACDFDMCLKAQVSRKLISDDDDSDTNIISIDSFKLMPYLGIGGAGVVRAAKKLGGHDNGQGCTVN